MLPNEFVKDMYSHLNVIVNELNAICLTKVSDAYVLMKIISMLPANKYGSHHHCPHNMDNLRTMTLAVAIGNIAAFEMARNIGQEEATSAS